jgi:hypothetical protein
MKRLAPNLSIACLALVTGLVLAVAGTACTENPVGRPCFIGADAGTGSETILASPALECQSRICLSLSETFTGGKPAQDLCTGECERDDDCDKVPESPCKGGFTCAVPVTAGPFCCKKMCICNDYLTIPAGGLQLPAACDPSNPINECCNLDGRRENPDYPACR